MQTTLFMVVPQCGCRRLDKHVLALAQNLRCRPCHAMPCHLQENVHWSQFLLHNRALVIPFHTTQRIFQKAVSRVGGAAAFAHSTIGSTGCQIFLGTVHAVDITDLQHICRRMRHDRKHGWDGNIGRRQVGLTAGRVGHASNDIVRKARIWMTQITTLCILTEKSTLGIINVAQVIEIRRCRLQGGIRTAQILTRCIIQTRVEVVGFTVVRTGFVTATLLIANIHAIGGIL